MNFKVVEVCITKNTFNYLLYNTLRYWFDSKKLLKITKIKKPQLID